MKNSPPRLAQTPLAEVEFGQPKTDPCRFTGICRISLARADEPMKTGCQHARALLDWAESGRLLRFRFLSKTIQPCALAKHFSGGIFRINVPTDLPPEMADGLGFSEKRLTIMPGQYAVRITETYRTVCFLIHKTTEKSVVFIERQYAG